MALYNNVTVIRGKKQKCKRKATASPNAAPRCTALRGAEKISRFGLTGRRAVGKRYFTAYHSSGYTGSRAALRRKMKAGESGAAPLRYRRL